MELVVESKTYSLSSQKKVSGGTGCGVGSVCPIVRIFCGSIGVRRMRKSPGKERRESQVNTQSLDREKTPVCDYTDKKQEWMK